MPAQRSSPLHQAAMAGDLVRIGKLLAENANPNVRDDGGRSGFVVFCAHSDGYTLPELIDALRLFIAHGADPALADHEGFTAWHSLFVKHPEHWLAWLPETLRSQSDIDAWFDPPSGRLDPLHTFIPFGLRAAFSHDPHQLRAMLEQQLLNRTVAGAPPLRSPRRF